MRMSQRKIVLSFVCFFNVAFSLIAFSSASDQPMESPLPLPLAGSLERSEHLNRNLEVANLAASLAEAEETQARLGADHDNDNDNDNDIDIDNDEDDDAFPALPRFHSEPLRWAVQVGGAAAAAAEGSSVIDRFGLATPPFPLSTGETVFQSPLTLVPPRILRSQSARQLSAHDKPLQIMIVDDGLPNRKLLSKMIEGRFKKNTDFLNHCNIDMASEGKEFMLQFEAKRLHLAAKHAQLNSLMGHSPSVWEGPIADVIFLDENMPGDEGSVLAWKIRKYELKHKLKHTPIHMYSAGNSDEVLYAAYSDAFSKVAYARKEGDNPYAKILKSTLGLDSDSAGDEDIARRFERLSIYGNIGKPANLTRLAPMIRRYAEQAGLPAELLK